MIDAASRDAWSDLEARLRPFVARRVRAEDVDDVLQDVFLRMHRGLADLRDDQRFGPWVYRVAKSAIADHRRALARHPSAGGHAAPAEETKLEDEDRAAEHVLAANVGLFVALLPSPYREALTLTELEGVSQKEAAAMTGVSVSAMKSRVQRGRQRLRALLEACCAIALDARGKIVECRPRTSADGCCQPASDERPRGA
ncbi:MAG: sigma-70 family RNA polymerase sigma factor [Sandaracinaceae bacterium]|nr:sigma-70 family RNA polymerase sigma factor [Sandaracinaceae bacterium]